jgi:hypothetical protein
VRRISLALLFFVSCGGSKPEPVQPKPPPAETHEEDTDEVSASAKAAAAAAPKNEAPVSTGGPLDALFDKTVKKADFPKKTVKDGECLRQADLVGKADKDYEAITAKCGAPTGMKEYTKKASGNLDGKKPRDIYRVKMAGGFCYRFWAVADKEIADIDIRVQTPKGALVSIDQSKHSVAVLDPDEPWCKTHDREFDFVVETQGGKGAYVFGVWARPK